MPGYVALLRGINVGGNNIIKMSALKHCFEELGFSDVATYIQSGNVLFSAPSRGVTTLSNQIEHALQAAFGVELRIVLRSHTQLRAIVDKAPEGFGSQPARYRYDVVFLRPPLTVKAALADLRTREGVDEAFAGVGVCYFSRLEARATQSYLSRVVALPSYKSMTIRNWSTTTKLLARLDAVARV